MWASVLLLLNAICMTYTYHCCVYSENLLMMETKCLKHVEFYSKNKFEKLVHLVGFIIRSTASLLLFSINITSMLDIQQLLWQQMHRCWWLSYWLRTCDLDTNPADPTVWWGPQKGGGGGNPLIFCSIFQTGLHSSNRREYFWSPSRNLRVASQIVIEWPSPVIYAPVLHSETTQVFYLTTLSLAKIIQFQVLLEVTGKR